MIIEWKKVKGKCVEWTTEDKLAYDRSGPCPFELGPLNSKSDSSCASDVFKTPHEFEQDKIVTSKNHKGWKTQILT